MLSIFPQLFTYQLFAIFALRIVLAIIFIGHGYSKLFKTFESASAFFDSIKLKPGRFWTRIIGITELLSGVFLLIGFLTQPAAIAIAILMIAVMFKTEIRKVFFEGWEFPLLVLVAALLLIFTGPGVFAIDLPL